MIHVYKYLLDLVDYQAVPLPAGAEILSVAEQLSGLVMWAKVDPARPTVPRDIIIKGTGHPITNDELGRFIGTALMYGGTLVWHVFEAR